MGHWLSPRSHLINNNQALWSFRQLKSCTMCVTSKKRKTGGLSPQHVKQDKGLPPEKNN